MILVQFRKVFNVKKFLICLLLRFDRNLICATCYLYFLIGNLNQNIYSNEFHSVCHAFKVTNVRDLKLSSTFFS